MNDHVMIDARFFLFGLFFSAAVGAISMRLMAVQDDADLAHKRCAELETHVAELNNRLVEAESFVEFAKPLWYGNEKDNNK